MDPTDRWKAIAPASDESGQQRSVPDPKKRRQAVPVACIQCRTGKAKCDGTRPRCTRCRDNELPCQYDVAEGVTRAERMKLLKRDSMSNKIEELERIINALRSGTDLHASTVLARLRLGERVEDVAKSLPASSSTQSKTPSLVAQQSSNSSGGAVTQESITTLGESRVNTVYSHGSNPSLDINTGHQPGWQEPSTVASPKYSSSSRGRQGATTDTVDRPPFLSILFDRDDYLLARSESEDEVNEDENLNENIDPRLFPQASMSRIGVLPLRPPGSVSRSGTISPKGKQTVRSIHATHLISRQQIVNAVTVHPNLNLHSLFGNMPFASGIRANNYPTDTQQAQIDNLSIPTWAMMTMNSTPDPGSLKDAFAGILQEATSMIQNGTPAELVIEEHPNIAALFDESEYKRSGILSRWAAGMVHSVQLKGNDFTCMASMYVFWYLMRWMIFPSPETYECIPEWLRPTPNQLFMPHIKILDFVIWPAFRELAVQIPAMQERMEWLMDMCNTVRCDWSFTTEEAICRNEETGLWDLCSTAKACVRDMSNWSLGPSFRGYVSNADSYVRVRAEVV